MNEDRLVFTWRAMLLAFLLPLVLLWAMDLTMGGSRLRHGQFAKVWECYLDLLHAWIIGSARQPLLLC